MYQSGYLTIKGLSKTEVDEVGNHKLVLGAPNHEVRGAIRAGWFNGFLKVPADDFTLTGCSSESLTRCVKSSTAYSLHFIGRRRCTLQS